MLRSYLKTAWRNIIKYRFHSAVNVIGLFAGITFTLLIGAFVWSELQVNKKLQHAGNQYILRSDWKNPNLGIDFATLAPLAKRLKEEYPSLVANYYRFDAVTSVVSKGDKHLREKLQLGDSTLLSMYGFELLHGNSTTALVNPYSVVITKEQARKYFGKTDVVGETLSIQSFSGSDHPFTITGVLKEVPRNSVTLVNEENNNTFFIPSNTIPYFQRNSFEDWSNIYIVSYIELKDGVKSKDLEQPVKRLIDQHAPDHLRQHLTVTPVELGDFYMQQDSGLTRRMLYTLSLAGLFILLMAVVNFINIAVSRSATRIREIGIRKLLGGMKKQLIFQFLTESAFIVFIATILALLAYPQIRPLFSQLVGKEIPAYSDFPLSFILIPFGLVLVTGILAGLYPAFVLSSLKSVDAVKGKLKTIKESTWFRKSLVGFQFSIALIVLIAAVIVTQQVAYFFNRELGYEKEYVVSAQVPRDWTPQGVNKMETILDQFATIPQVSKVSLSFEIPDGGAAAQVPFYTAGMDSTQGIAMDLVSTDEHYLDVYQIPLLTGTFTKNEAADGSGIVLNEKAVQALGWKTPEEAIGKQIRTPGFPGEYTVMGVTKDFHFGSMHQAIHPMIFFNVKFNTVFRYLSFKIKPGNVSKAIEAIQQKWATLLPVSSFEYKFMDDTLKQLYNKEFRLKNAAYTATVLALIIVLLGVLGLVSLSIHKRIKEIGIRKVLGASMPGIILLFVKEFIVIIAIAGIIACPVAWIIMQGWLDNYVYRISINAQPFILSIGLLCVITLLIIGLQALKASSNTALKSLKTE
jgi:putative ABC transport system permease protein